MKNKIRKLLYNNKITKHFMVIRKRLYDWRLLAFPIIKQKNKNPNSVFYVLIPEHGNIGDHAITIATEKILCDANIEYIEISDQKLFELQEYGFLNIFNGRTIIVNGGGNLGTLWFNLEKVFRNIIKFNKKSNIICLPNTMYYEDSEYGQEEFENSVKIYNEHPNLHLFSRERISYELMKNAYKNVYLVPDMVLSMDFSKDKLTRCGCLLCFRNDLEKAINSEIINRIEDFARSNFENSSYTDMCISKKIDSTNRYDEFVNKINQFKMSELVITDRLHAMIFCAITGTPCIIFNSKSHKLKGCYEWIKNLEYIKFTDNPDDIQQIYDSLSKDNNHYDYTYLAEYYDVLKEILLKYCKGID